MGSAESISSHRSSSMSTQQADGVFGKTNVKNGSTESKESVLTSNWAMDTNDRLAIILGVTKNREGNLKDMRALGKLLPTLGYQVISKEDPTKKEMIGVLRELQKLNTTMRSLIVFVMCHGGEDGKLIAADDKTLNIRDLYDQVRGNVCKSFESAPKIFIVNACRGSSHMASDGDDDDAPEVDAKLARCPASAHENFYTISSTIEGFVSWRDTSKGSYLIQNLIPIWKKHFFKDDIQQLTVKVRRKVRAQLNGANTQVVHDQGTLMFSVRGGEYVETNE